MMRDINRTAFLVIWMFFLTFSCAELESQSFDTINQRLISKEIILTLPTPFHYQAINEDESISYIYSFIDSAYLIIGEGALIEFPMDKYEPRNVDVKNQKTTITGLENGKFWRKDLNDGIRIYYGNVDSKNKSMYDNVLDSVIIINCQRKER